MTAIWDFAASRTEIRKNQEHRVFLCADLSLTWRIQIGLTAWALYSALGSAIAQQPIVTKFSHVVALDTPKGIAAEFFAKKANELTKGRVEVYGNSTLYKDKKEMEALQLGAVQMLAPSLAKFGSLGVREFELFDLPYLGSW